MVSEDIRMVQEVFDNNSENIPENDRITGLNALMRMYNNLPNQGSANTITGYESRTVVTMNEMGMGHFYFDNSLLPGWGDILPHQQPSWIAEWILKQIKKRSENNFGHADFNFDIGEEFSEINNSQRTNYEEIKTKVIPILQSKGFDIALYHENTNFEEDNTWGDYIGGMTVSWDPEFNHYNYMVDQREFFSKTRDRYYYIDVSDEESDNEEEEEIETRPPYLCVRHVLPENRISHAKSFVFKWVRKHHEYGLGGTDFMLDNAEGKLTYTEIKTQLIPLLQSDGFDVSLYYTIDNQFDEEHFDGSFCVNWEENNVPPSDYMLHKIERFSKTTAEYHSFEN